MRPLRLAIALPLIWLVLACGYIRAGLLEEGVAAKTAGNLKKSADLLGKAVATDPRNVEAWYQYGTVLGWLGRLDEALNAIKKGIQVKPSHFDLRMAEARILSWKADFPAADACLAALDVEYPDNEEIMVMQGRIAGWRGEPVEAQKFYVKVLEKNPNQVDALTGMGDLEMDKARFKKARELYVRAQAIDPAPDIQKRIERIDEQPKARVDVGVSGSTFRREERDDWWGTYLAVSTKIQRWGLWGRWEYGERFALRDDLWEFGVAGPVVPGVAASLFAGFTPEADYNANAYAEGTASWRIFKKVGTLGVGKLLTEGRWADYEAAQVNTYRLGWEQELRDGWTVNARWVRLSYDTGDETDGWVAFLSWAPKEGWQVQFGGGQSVESLNNQTIRTDQVLESWSLFGSLIIPISKVWHLRFDLEYEDVKDSVARYGMAVGVGRDF